MNVQGPNGLPNTDAAANVVGTNRDLVQTNVSQNASAQKTAQVAQNTLSSAYKSLPNASDSQRAAESAIAHSELISTRAFCDQVIRPMRNRAEVIVDFIQPDRIRMGSGCNGIVWTIMVKDRINSAEKIPVVVKLISPKFLNDSGKEDMVSALLEDKFCHAAEEQTSKAYIEANIASQFNSHPNCCHLLAAHEIPNHPDHVDVSEFEFLNGGTLQEKLEKPEEMPKDTRTKIQWAQQLASAVAYINSKGFVHRDIKPANIMFSDGNIKLIDFGCCAPIGKFADQDGNAVATPPNFIFKDNKILPNAKYDSWGLGWTLLGMFLGDSETYLGIRQEWLNSSPQMNLGTTIHNLLKDQKVADIIAGLLDPNLETRLSAKDAEYGFSAM